MTTQYITKHTKFVNLYKLYTFGFFDDKCTVIKEFDTRLLKIDDVQQVIIDHMNSDIDDDDDDKVTTNDLVCCLLPKTKVDQFWTKQSYDDFLQIKDDIIMCIECADYDESDLFFVTHEYVAVNV